MPEISPYNISFLDLMITKSQGSLVTSLFTKPTDRNTLLHYQSAHPKHLLNSLSISQFLKIAHICSNEGDKQQQLNKMYDTFLERGYPTEVLDHALARSMTTHTKPTGALDRPLFIHTFNQESDQIRQGVTQSLHFLQADNTLMSDLTTMP